MTQTRIQAKARERISDAPASRDRRVSHRGKVAMGSIDPDRACEEVEASSSRGVRLDALGPAGRLDHYKRGKLSRSDLWVWAARFPEEVPLVNGELPWISLSLADVLD